MRPGHVGTKCSFRLLFQFKFKLDCNCLGTFCAKMAPIAILDVKTELAKLYINLGVAGVIIIIITWFSLAEDSMNAAFHESASALPSSQLITLRREGKNTSQ